MRIRYPATSVIISILRVLSLLSFAIGIIAFCFLITQSKGLTTSEGILTSILIPLVFVFYGIVVLAASEALRMMMDIATNSFYLEELANARVHQSSPERGATPYQPPPSPPPDLSPLPVYDPASEQVPGRHEEDSFMKLVEGELASAAAAERRTTCNRCGTKLKIPASFRGTRAKCPKCSAVVTLG